MVNNRWSWLFIAFTCLSAPAVAVTQLQAQIDKNPVMYGEEILLSFSRISLGEAEATLTR